MGKDHYRPDKNDPEYIDNWVEKYDLMCQPKTRMGLFGLWFFIGVITTIMLTPWVSDIYGRWELFIASLVVSFVVQFVLIVSNDLTTA